MEYYNASNANEGGPGASGMQRMQLPLCDRIMTTEVTQDYSLPDYQPEIKRLLRVSATVQPANRYVGGGSMEFSGTVDFCIYYAGNDGQLYCFPTSAEYAFRVPLEATAEFDLNDGLFCYAISEAESIVSRVSGPRKMNIKCRLRARVRAYGRCVLEEKRQGDACDEERLLQEAITSDSAYGISEPLVVSEEILLEQEDGKVSEVRIISGDAQVMVSEASCAGGQVHCRGEVVLKLLLQRENTEGQASEPPMVVVRKLPLNGEIAMDGATINGEAVATGCCTALNLSLEDGRVLCDAEIVLEARTQCRQSISYTADWYAAGRRSDCVTTRYALPVAGRVFNGNFTQSDARSLDELGIAKDAKIIDVAGNAIVEGVEAEKARYIVTGKCRYSLILLSDGEMSAKELELPFRYMLDGGASEQAIHPFLYEAQVHSVIARARTDGERLAIDGELAVAGRTWYMQEVQMVSGVTVGEEIPAAAGQLRLCYPTGDDTLWTVAKRYHAPLDALMQRNRLEISCRADDQRSLGGIQVLAI